MLSYSLIDWLGKDLCYYSLLAVYNETQVFAGDHPLLQGESNECDVGTAANPLSSNLRQFRSKEDWVVGKWEMTDVQRINEFLKYRLAHITLDGCDTDECRINSFGIFLHPAVQYTINYLFNDRNLLCIFPMATMQTLQAETPEHAQFLYNVVKTLHLQGSINIELEGNRWKI